MKKHLLNLKTLALCLGLSWLGATSFAQQQVGNSDFESWENVGSNTEEPQNWNSNMTGAGNASLGGQTLFREGTIVHSGSYSAKIETGSAFFGTVTVNGAMTLGQVNAPSTDPNDGFNMTIQTDANFGEALTNRPDSIVFWANYSETGTADSARISAVLHDAYDLHDPQDAGSSSHVVATARDNFQTGGANWVRFSLPFDYSGPASTVEYIIVTFTSSYVPGSGVQGAVLYIDDVELIYNTPSNSIAPTAVQNLIENEAGTTLTVTEGGTAQYPSTADSRQWKYSTTSGGPYTNTIAGETNTTYTPQFATAGTYYVVCESTFGATVATSNEVQINVATFSNSIAPTATQNIVENVAGTQLTVTETPTADTREWKYSTTSGSGYVSFATAETGTTYTPLFATAGTYYVVCESTLAGQTVTSNEVEIIVAVAVSNTVSIAPTGTQNLIENQSGNLLTANENPSAAVSREWMWTTTSGSGYASFAPAETGFGYTPMFATAGTYYVVCVSDFGGGDIQTSNEVQINVSTFSNNVTPTATQNLIENQAGSMLTVTETPTADTREWKYSTTSGSGYVSFATAETGTTYTPLFATAGTYYVVCESTLGGITVTSNEVEIVVSTFSNAIAPAATQNIVENVAGTQLTVSETPTANSREWKYSTTSGSGYVSFATAETGTSYTPLFATAGTYYVVCESTLAGQTVTSNEVEITVVSATSNTVTLSPDTTQHLDENEAGTMITAIETPNAATSREWKWTTTSGSGYASFSPAETTTTYTPQFATAGTYYVVCVSDFAGDVVTSAEVTIIVTDVTGIEENTLENILVYSTNNNLNVDLSGTDLKNASIQVVNMAGKVIATQSLNNGQMNHIDVNVPTGIYFFSISNGSQLFHGKVFVK